MSQTEVVFSGFGGQGALFAGQVLAEAALLEDRHVTWLPSYGPEMRGGTAHCIVIVADEPIGSPIVQRPRAVIALNRPSLTKYEPLVAVGGCLVINTSLVPDRPTRTDVTLVDVPATETAEELGSVRLTNIVALGALLATLPVVGLEATKQALAAKVAKAAPDLAQANQSALQAGFAWAEKLRSATSYAVPRENQYGD
jgi:2-oxoglutarate ferredoxin oxidoreductase subunit gamma